MRDALADKMILSLVRDIVDALGARVPPSELTHNLFDTLANGGHAKLLAWRAVENSKGFSDPQPVAELFNRLLEKTKEIVDVDTDADARQMIYLVACAAIGHGLAGNVLSGLLGMPEDEVDGFPKWMSSKLEAPTKETV